MEHKIVGTHTLSNTSAIVIMDDLNEDSATSGFLHLDEIVFKVRKTKVYWSSSGRAYIRRYGVRYYMDEFLRL